MARELGRLLTAMVTPFRDDGSVDYDAAQTLATLLTDNGSDGVVVFGTTGEAPALTDAEKLELLRAVRQAIPDKNVVAGTGSNSTEHSVHLTESAIEAGADGILAVVPYYNKPPQEGMYRHFKAITAAAGGKPVVMYNIQGRTGVNMTAATTLRCAEIPGIAGVKEASGDIDQMGLVCAGAPKGFKVWSGDAGPAIRELIEAFNRGDTARAREIHGRLLPVIKALMTTASNPIPIKTALNRLGFPAGPFRLPLTPLPDADADRLMAVVKEAGELISLPAGVR
jgi:4-hydroxy-tetrahydrodipicolinate synthase